MIILSGDIGGTHTRLRLIEFADSKNDNVFKIINNAVYSNTDFTNFTEILDIFFSKTEIVNNQVRGVCLGVAGPIIEGTVKFTNLPWTVKTSIIQEKLSLEQVILLNDFTAIGYGLETLQPNELVILQPGKPDHNAIKAYIGAGTGLGIGFISHHRGTPKVYPTEGGHIDFAPTNDEQIELLKFLRTKHHRISFERIVSGPGLVNIYHFVRSCPRADEIENPQLASLAETGSKDFAAVISEHALEHHDPMAQRALDIFIAVYGAAVGNLALTTLPFGGLYIVGGIAPKLLSQIKGATFSKSFGDKGRMSKLLEDIPIYVVLCTEVGIRGAALYAKKLALDQVTLNP